MLIDILIAALLGQAAAVQPLPVLDVRNVKVSAPRTLAEIDTTKVKGTPVGLAWRSDGAIYLRVTQGTDRTRHYQIATTPVVSVGQSDQAPVWAANYWTWKSGVSAPGEPTLKIDVEQRREKARSVNVSSGADLAGMSSAAMSGGGSGGEGMAQNVAVAAAASTMTNQVVSMRFKGQLVGEWTNEPPQPGVRYGWAPSPMGALAFVDAEGRLTLIDRDGRKTTVAGATKALLPAWSMDGRQIAFLEKKTPSLYVLMTVDVL